MRNFIPVFYGSRTIYIYSNKERYEIPKLLKVKALLSAKNGFDDYVDDNNHVYFEDGTAWSVPAIALALRAYDIAESTKFVFFPIKNKTGEDCLLVSKKVGSSTRFLINCMTNESVVVKSKHLSERFFNLTYTAEYTSGDLFDMFTAAKKQLSNENVLVDALVVNKGTENEFVALSPILYKWQENLPYVTFEDIIMIMCAIDKTPQEADTPYYAENNILYRDNYKHWAPMSVPYMRKVLKRINNLHKTKNSYYCIANDITGDPALYISSNYRYLVKASTFECVVLSNVYLMNKLKEVSECGEISQYEALNIWNIAAEAKEHETDESNKERCGWKHSE